MLNGVQAYNDDVIRELLFKQIDRNAYLSMKKSAEQIEQDLSDALDKLHKIILSEEEKTEIEKQRQIEAQMREEADHECRENDANVSIKDEDEIEKLFHECLSSFVMEIEENLRFRNDIEIVNEYDMNAGTMGSALLISSYIDDTEIELNYKMSLDPDEGADSTLCIYSKAPEFSTELTYKNGAVEYDADSGLYMPVIQDELESADRIVDEVMELINELMPDYKEIIDEDDIAGYALCSECGERAICINEDILPLGTCMNCRHANEVHECERCGSWFNSDGDGMYEDGVAICQNCLDYLDED